MKRILLLLLLTLACDAEIRLTMPFCPVSDSAKAKADSVPVLCILPDSLPRR